MTPVVKTIGLSAGVQVNYAEQGDPAGAPVVLLHGFTDSRKSFDLVLPHLPSSIRAYAITQRGHGDSERPESGYRSRDLGVITAPTLIVWGDRDSFCRREDQDALRAALPHARFVVYENAGHALHWEEPERFAAEVEGFVTQLKSARQER